MNDKDSNGVDPRAFARREFLRRLGVAGAAGAGYLALGGVAHAAGRIVPAGASGGALMPRVLAYGDTRPFHVVAIGDSVMWGQGLSEEQKFRNIVCAWLRENNLLRREVRQFNYSHSGAIIAHGPMAGERENATEAEGWGGEIPRHDPTVVRQIGIAVEDLGRNGVAPEDVDLILMDGGANDVDFMGTLTSTDPTIDTPYVRRRIEDNFVGPRMGVVLPEVLDTFPNAKVLLTGYYQGISAQTPAATIATLLSVLFNVAAPVLTGLYFDKIIRKNAEFVASMDRVLGRLAREEGRGRTFYVSPAFGEDNAIGAPRSFIWDLPQTDPAERGRRAECHDLYVQGKHGTGLSNLTNSAMCDEANTFHPNPAGAQRYAERIIPVLTRVMPEWAGLRRMAVRVEGTPSADESTRFTVVATDAETGAPVSALVSADGVRRAPANVPISLPLCHMVRRPSGIDPDDRGAPLVKGGRVSDEDAGPDARRVCTGTLTVRAPGYATSYVRLDNPGAPAPSAVEAQRARQLEEQRQRAAAEEEARRRAAAEEEATRRAATEEARRRAEAARRRAREVQAENPRRKPRGRPEEQP